MITNHGHLLFTYKKPTDMITTVTWSPDGKRIAYSANDNSVVLLDAETGSVVDTYNASSYGYVASVLWSLDSHQLISCYYNGQIIAWDLLTGTKRFIYQGSEDDHLIECALSLDGTAIVSSGGNDNSFMQIWHVETGALMGFLESQPFDQDQQESLELDFRCPTPLLELSVGLLADNFLPWHKSTKCISGNQKRRICCTHFPQGKKRADMMI